MAQPSTLYRFKIELSDIDRGVYGPLEFRIAMHPSENSDFLLTRVLAFALNSAEGLEFSPQGLGDPEAPAICRRGDHGNIDLWIEIGSPSAKKLHKASKQAQAVKIYTYKDAKVLLRELASQHVHKLEEIELFALPLKFLEKLAAYLERDNRWSILVNDGTLTIHIGADAVQTEIHSHSLRNLE